VVEWRQNNRLIERFWGGKAATRTATRRATRTTQRTTHRTARTNTRTQGTTHTEGKRAEVYLKSCTEWTLNKSAAPDWI